jgi:ribosome-binding factor A
MTTIGRKLQMKEGAFRTAITQQINFKRIPKLTFRAYQGKKSK